MAGEWEEERRIAEDYRRQLQERHPEYAGDIDAQQVLQWTQEEGSLLEEVEASFGHQTDGQLLNRLQCELGKPLANHRDEPLTHSIVRTLCDEVEDACREADIPLRSGVACGVSPTFDVNAERFPVPLTNTSVVTLSAGLIGFCSHVSKVMSLSLLHVQGEGASFTVSLAPQRVFSKIGCDPDLKRYWTEIIGAYAYGSGPLNVKQRIVPYPESISRAQMLLAMERFSIAHEYGHHVAGHGKKESAEAGPGEDSFIQEHEADLFALGLSRFMERNEPQPNMYALSGAGAVLLLKFLDCVRRTRRIFESGDDVEQRLGTHPELIERMAYFDYFDEQLHLPENKVYRQMRDEMGAIVDSVWGKLRPWFLQMHKDGLRPETHNDSWLPR